VIRTIISGLAIVALFNMVVLGGLAVWLRATDRLDGARIREVRELFAETAAERDARRQDNLAAVDRQREADERRAREAMAPLPAAEVLAIRLENNQADLARLDAIRREVQILQDTLRRERRALDEERVTLRREREEFERARRIIIETEGSTQFRKTLATYEALKPERARAAFGHLIANGEIDQVVAYLNSMQERTRTRIVDEFLRDQPAVATDLLERLRLRGLAARSPESSPG
jgi:hypothetical protein